MGLKLKTQFFYLSLYLYDDVDKRVGLMSATYFDSRKCPCCALCCQQLIPETDLLSLK